MCPLCGLKMIDAQGNIDARSAAQSRPMSETNPTSGTARRKYRKLRIAFSATCGIICLLLIALWVRSYYRVDSLEVMPDSGMFSIRTAHG